ncbi:hypothetical protein J3459_013809 [Metarhizium acridum]|nr:hypothetical protein J3459_013809 [Metarhizium acridum]
MAELQWESIDNSRLCLDKLNLLPLPAPPEEDVSLPYDISNLQNFSLAVSGRGVFVGSWIIPPRIVLQRMLVRGKIFARMSPDESMNLWKSYKASTFAVVSAATGLTIVVL